MSVIETDLIEGNQMQSDKIVNDATIDNSFKQSQDDLLSQKSVDLMVDSGNEHEETEIMDNDAMDSELVTGGKNKMYSVQQILHFLDTTKGLCKPKIETYFPDLKLFLLSGTMAMRKASFDELDKPKRYRLKKLLSNVRSSLNLQGKK